MPVPAKSPPLIVGLVVALALLLVGVYASDHADTRETVDRAGTDLTDVFVFPSATDPNNVVLAMCVHGLIPTGQGPSTSFDPGVLYQFKIDNSGDNIEDVVIQATFEGMGSDQRAVIHGPSRPSRVGTVSELLPPNPTTGQINTVFSPRANMQVFCGAREDPFFFDLERFYAIFPDRQTPITKVPVPDPNTPRLTSWRPPGEAQDFFKDMNVLAVVVELPRSDLGSGVIGVWCTTSL